MSLEKIGIVAGIAVPLVGGLIWLGSLSATLSELKEKTDKIDSRVLKAETLTEKLLSQDYEQRLSDRVVKGASENVEELLSQKNLDFLATLPIGTIVPYVGSHEELKKLKEWKLCDGNKLEGERYRDSPFFNGPLPNLDGVFLRGTAQRTRIFSSGGIAKVSHAHGITHAHQMPHMHSGKTGASEHFNSSPRDHHHKGGDHAHSFTTGQPNPEATGSASNAHSEKVEIELLPPFVEVLYIIKVI